MSQTPAPTPETLGPALLRWVGGKSRSAAAIVGRLPTPRPGGRYLEPFAGSLAVQRARVAAGHREPAILGDANAGLMNVYRMIQQDPRGVAAALAALSWGPTARAAYAETRRRHNADPQIGPVAAARFIWLNRAGFRGLYRTDRHGNLNTAPGAGRLLQPTPARLAACGLEVAGATLITGSWERTLGRAEAGDVVYCDPPYLPPATSASFASYTPAGFGLSCHRALARAAVAAARRGITVAISNRSTPVVNHLLYPPALGWTQHRIAVPWCVGAAKGRRQGARTPEIFAILTPTRVLAQNSWPR